MRRFEKYLRNSLNYSTEHRPLLKVKKSYFLNQGQKTHHWSLLSASWIQYKPSHPTNLRHISTIPYRLHTDLPDQSISFSTSDHSQYSILFSPKHFLQKFPFCSKLLRSPVLAPKSEETPLFLCPVRLIFAVTLHTWRPSTPSATPRSAMLFWQRAHLTCWEWSPMLTIKWHSPLCKNALQK